MLLWSTWDSPLLKSLVRGKVSSNLPVWGQVLWIWLKPDELHFVMSVSLTPLHFWTITPLRLGKCSFAMGRLPLLRWPLPGECPFSQDWWIQNFRILFWGEVLFDRRFWLLIVFLGVSHWTRNRIVGISLFFFIESFLMLFERYRRVNCWL